MFPEYLIRFKSFVVSIQNINYNGFVHLRFCWAALVELLFRLTQVPRGWGTLTFVIIQFMFGVP